LGSAVENAAEEILSYGMEMVFCHWPNQRQRIRGATTWIV
jgi:hypothetical protein